MDYCVIIGLEGDTGVDSLLSYPTPTKIFQSRSNPMTEFKKESCPILSHVDRLDSHRDFTFGESGDFQLCVSNSFT